MKTAIHIEADFLRVVITPESDFEKMALSEIKRHPDKVIVKSQDESVILCIEERIEK